MHITDAETMLLELLREKEEQAQRDAQQRMLRFLTGVSQRTGIPVEYLNIHTPTGEITDTRVQTATPEMTGDNDDA